MANKKDNEKEVWQAIGKLTDEVRSGFEKVGSKFEKVENEFEKVRNGFEKVWQVIGEVWQAIGKLTDEVRSGFTSVRSEIGKINEKLGWTLNDIALGTVPLWLEKYEKIRIRNLERFLHDSLELDLFYEGKDFVVAGEVKHRIGLKNVDELINNIKVLKEVRPSVKDKRIIPVIFCYAINLEARKFAKKKRVRIIATYTVGGIY